MQRFDKRCETPMAERIAKNTIISPRMPKHPPPFRLTSGAYLFTGSETTQAPWRDVMPRPTPKRPSDDDNTDLRPSPRFNRGLKAHETKQKDGSPRHKEPAVFDLGFPASWRTATSDAYYAVQPEEGIVNRPPNRYDEANLRRISPGVYQSVFARDIMSTPRAMKQAGLKPLESGRKHSSHRTKPSDGEKPTLGSLAMSRREARAHLRELDNDITTERLQQKVLNEGLLAPHLRHCNIAVA